jgi:hypothetical protein
MSILERLRDPNGVYGYQSQLACEAADRISALEAENAELRKDAERYRWILHQSKITDMIFEYTDSRERHVSNAIDQALKEAQS